MTTPEVPSKKNKLFDLVDKAPFSGKFVVKDSYIGYTTASDEKKNRKALTSMAFLGFMAAAHAYQAKLGFDSLAVHAPEAIDNLNAKDIIFSGIDGTYALAMSAVALRQANLVKKVGAKHVEWRKTRHEVSESERRIEKREYANKAGAVGLALGVTLTGQVIGGVSLVDARMSEYSTPQTTHETVHEYSDEGDIYTNNTIYIDPLRDVAVTDDDQ